MMLVSSLGFSQETETQQESNAFDNMVKEYATELLSFVKTEGGQLYDLAKDEVPIIIQQWLMYECVINWLVVLLSIVIFILGHKLAKKATREDWSGYDDNFAGNMIYTITISISATLFLIFINSAIKVTFFPKLYLIEQFTSLL